MTQPYYPNPQPSQEVIFYQDINVIVTSSRLIIGPRTFMLSGITSVYPAVISPQRAGPSIFMALGLIILFSAFAQIAKGFTDSTLTQTLVGAACVIGSLIWFVLQKTNYSIKLGTYGGEVDGFIAENENYITMVANTINQALANKR